MVELNDEDVYRRALSQRLQLVMDVVEANRGAPPTFAEIQAGVVERGSTLSRPRWQYMLSGNGPIVRDQTLLEALADFFGVPAAYFVDPSDGDLPERITAQLELVRSLHKKRVYQYATRQLNPLLRYSTESIREMKAAIDALEAHDEA